VRRVARAWVALLALVGALAAAAPATAIYGGRLTRPGEAPWTAALRISGDIGVPCTAVVIAPAHALTAAHCVEGKSARRLTLVTGSGDVTSGRARKSAVRAVAIHPDYQRADTYYDDFAVLTLARPLPSALVVRLAGPGDHALSAKGATLRIAGWGITLFHGHNLPTALRVGRVKALGPAPCQRAFPLDFDGDLMVCGGGPRRGRGWVQACAGDSGGPVTGTGQRGEPVLVAITSFGNQCGDPVESFSRIEAVLPWLVSAAGVAVPPGMVAPPRPVLSTARLAPGPLRRSALNLPAGATMKLYSVTRSRGFTFPVQITSTQESAVDLDTSGGVRGVGVAYVQAFAFGPLAWVPVR
jgi:hypothetical protein